MAALDRILDRSMESLTAQMEARGYTGVYAWVGRSHGVSHVTVRGTDPGLRQSREITAEAPAFEEAFVLARQEIARMDPAVGADARIKHAAE